MYVYSSEYIAGVDISRDSIIFITEIIIIIINIFLAALFIVSQFLDL